MTELHTKSLHELRGVAQAFGVSDVFRKDAVHLAQEIELKQQAMIPKVVALPPRPQYDARLMTKTPSRRSSEADIESLLREHIALGLRLSFDEENWHMQYGNKTDGGTLRMPLRVVLQCAEKIMRGKRAP